MNIPRHGPITEGLIYEADIPFCWQILSDNPPAHESLKLHESNRQLLQLLLKDGTVQDIDTLSDPVALEMHRLDLKLDLLITLVGTLLTKEAGIPVRRKVLLGAEGLQILFDSSSEDDVGLAECASNSSTSDCLVKVSMFLDAHFPQPLSFFARVDVIQQTGTGSLMVATFQSKDQEVQDLLEKFIFQQHRRVIASSRTEQLEH